MGRLKMDIFPHTTERAETVVDQLGRIDRQMTYFLSSRAMLKQSLCSREKPSKSRVSDDLGRK